MAEVMAANERLSCELFGGKRIKRLFQDFERVTVLSPMDWPAYQNFVLNGRGYIGLAPQLDIPFNRARSYTKFFDITRYGGVGIYSPGSENANVVQDNIEGVIADLNQQEWTEKILKLVEDKTHWQQMRENAEKKVSELDDIAQKSYQKL